MRNAEWGMRNAEWGMGSGECGMRNAECGMGNGEWGMGNGEWGMGNGYGARGGGLSGTERARTGRVGQGGRFLAPLQGAEGLGDESQGCARSSLTLGFVVSPLQGGGRGIRRRPRGLCRDRSGVAREAMPGRGGAGCKPALPIQATMGLMILPWTSVRRKWRPWYLKVRRSWSMPRRWRRVAWKSWMWTPPSTTL